MRRHFLPLILICCSLASLLADEGSLWKGLTPQQQEQLSSGQPVVLEEEVDSNPWPRYTVYHLVNSSAENVAAVFWDCEKDDKYIPNCIAVRILSRPEPWIHVGEYTLKMPFMLPNEIYVSRNDLNPTSPDGIYEISWKVLSSRYISASNGNLKIEPHGDKAFLCYKNLVIPGGKFAGLLRTKARNQVVESVLATVHQVETETKESPELLQHQVQDLEKSLPKPVAAPSPAAG